MWPSGTWNILNKAVCKKKRDKSWHNLVSAQNHAEAMVVPLITNVYTTCNAALNTIACMCQTVCDVTSSNVLGRLVQCEHRLSIV